MQFGDLELTTISGGWFRLDGGAMFGVVPKPLWSRVVTPDPENRIQLATRCVLIRTPAQTVLIETGYGGKLSPREREIYQAEGGEPLVTSLSECGVDPAAVDVVILTHLHFDHAGGATTRDADGTLRPTFPNAEYVVQRWEWQIATANFPELRGSYPLDNLLPLHERGQLRLIDGDAEVAPGIHVELTGGHTPGHQVVLIESAGQTAVFLGDLCPTAWHLPQLWCMGYDLELLLLRRQKRDLLGRIADGGWLALFDHDPTMAACRIQRDARRDFVVAEAIKSL